MNIALSVFRWITFMAAIPFLYFVLTDQPHNWLYNLSLGLILGAYVSQIIFLWRSGKRKEVKYKLLMAGALLTLFLILAFFK